MSLCRMDDGTANRNGGLGDGFGRQPSAYEWLNFLYIIVNTVNMAYASDCVGGHGHLDWRPSGQSF